MTTPQHTSDATAFRPYVPPGESPKEFSIGAIVLGILLGLVFAASSVYLALKIGLTVSASIPIAVLSITIFRYISRAFGAQPATILQNNIVQTTGSAGESIAAGDRVHAAGAPAPRLRAAVDARSRRSRSSAACSACSS